ncbi:MAG: acyl-phosphate glycerol 3-phosphate acyltransferase [Gammaproteobacteria bacterium]|nr:MAG: acyl-phosphate glycerol 3-phosphate acyltransferase [Gammaproteobacteria bacterium]
MDGLARAQIRTRLEREFGVALPDRVAADADTPRDLLRALDAAQPTAPPTKPAIREAEPPTPPTKAAGAGIPNTAQTLLDALRWHADRQGDRLHIRLYQDEEDGQTISYTRLLEGASELAAGLIARDIHPGDTVAIMLPTGAEYFFSFMGILLAGGIPVPLYPPVRRAQLEEHLRRHQTILENCQARAMITVPEAMAVARLLQAPVHSLRTVATPAQLMLSGERPHPHPARDTDTAFLQYTSGSTGLPKGVILSHANLLANIRAMGQALQVGASDVMVSWLPLYHDMGLIGAWLGSLYHGVPLGVMSPLDFLSRPRRWLQAIHRHGGTLSASPNFGYEHCLRTIQDEELEGVDLSTWRVAFNGAEPVSPETLGRFIRRFDAYGFRRESLMPVYGLAECSVGLAFPPLACGPRIQAIQRDRFQASGQAEPAAAEDTGALRFVACGHAIPGHEMRVVDAAGRELPDRQEGRLQFRGPSTTAGYLRNPEATAVLFHGDWLESGDRAYLDGGEVFITGRSKDIIIRAGRNIYPHELEDAAGEVPGIRQGRVAVFSAPDPNSATERLVVLAETRETDGDEQQRMREHINVLATELTQTPADEVVLAPPGTVLKTSSGKIRRAASRQLYLDGRLGQGTGSVFWQLTSVAAGTLKPALGRGIRQLGALAFATYAWTLMVLLAPPTYLAIVVLPGMASRWRAARGILHILLRATGTRLEVSGMKNIPVGAPCVLVANHQSYLDFLVITAALPEPVSFVAKGELAGSWVTRIPLVRLGTQFVARFDLERGADDLQRIVSVADQGRPLLFFPEGTFTRRPGLSIFRLGAFVAATAANVPVVPITLRGNRGMLRAGTWFPRQGSLRVHISEPIAPPASGIDAWSGAIALRDTARAEILRHCGEPDLGGEPSPMLALKAAVTEEKSE